MKHDPRRRVVLHGALATACALGAPLLLGCRAESPQEASGAQKTPPAPLMPSAVSAVIAKLSQEEAHYQDEPHDGQQCSNCLHFVAESNTCKVVEGEVSPEGWCMLWARKS